MSRRSKGNDGFEIFGFEEIEKSFAQMGKKYEDKYDALLMAQGRTALKRVKSKTPIGKTKKLKGSWRLKKVKQYGKNGEIRVIRIQSETNYTHLVELGHDIWTSDKKKGVRRKVSNMNGIGRKVYNAKKGGRVEGKKMLESTMKELQNGFFAAAEKILDEITKDVQL